MVKFKRSLKVKRELIKAIKEKEVQLSKLQAHVDKSSVCSDLYNKVVLEKAILKKELENRILTEHKYFAEYELLCLLSGIREPINFNNN